jgi:hypothetical protein
MAVALALLLLPTLAVGADWTSPKPVAKAAGARLDSMHQLASGRDALHVVHPRIGPGRTDDRVVYQRSKDDGVRWSKERPLFKATNQRRYVVPNLAIAARGDIVAVAWRVNGLEENALFVRVSRDRGRTFGSRDKIVATKSGHSIGVPAVAIGSDVVAVAWTNRANGKVKIRISRDKGRTFKPQHMIGATSLSIDCDKRVTDGLVGLAATGRNIHVAWSHAPKRDCFASSIKVRTSKDRGASWKRKRVITERTSFGWPELDARGKSVIATVQSPKGSLIVARSASNGRTWKDRVLKAPDGHNFSAADVALLPDKRAIITYVNERLKNDRLVGTKVISRFAPATGRKFKAPKVVVGKANRLRMAPNVVVDSKKASVVFQAGALDGSPRSLYASRLR